MVEGQTALISHYSQSTHESKINLRKVKWTREEKKKKITRKKVGRPKCLPPRESKSSPQRSVESKKKGMKERRKQKQGRSKREKERKKKTKPPFNHKKRTPKKIPYRRVRANYFPSPKSHLTPN
jgi:hypothetical protein